MKKIILPLLIVVLLIGGVAYFIPATLQKQVFVASTFQNIVSSVTIPRNWTKWNDDVTQAFQHDSSRCTFTRDSAGTRVSISVPGKNIQLTELNYLFYLVDENGIAPFTFSVTPYVGNGQPRSQHNSTIAYAQPVPLLVKWLPFMQQESFADRTIAGLVAYLQDNTRFYGFSIDLIQDKNILFLTQKKTVAQNDLFPAMTALASAVEKVAMENDCRPGFKDISFTPSTKDSTDLLVGINIDKDLEGSPGIGFMQLPAGQIMLTARYEGPFNQRKQVYVALEKYLLDHQLMKGAAGFERYHSPLPVFDLSNIQIDLCYPLRY